MTADGVTLTPDQLQALAGLVRQLEQQQKNSDTAHFSDSQIANDDVPDGPGARKGRRRMRTIDGPFPHGKRFRIRIRRKGGGQEWRSFGTEDEAAAELRKLRREEARNSGVTAAEALAEYREFLTSKKRNKSRSVDSTIYKVGGLLKPVENDPLATVTNGKKLYDAYMDGKSVDTHRNALAETKTFFRWAIKEGHVKASPFAEVEGVGTRKKGEKDQLGQDELVRYVAAGLGIARTTRSDRKRWRAVMAVMQGLFGTRPSELTNRVVRDLDKQGWVLIIPKGKTKKAKRRLAIPAFLHPFVMEIARARRPDEQIFPGSDKDVMRKAVRMVCKAAGVPLVSPYGLRGTYASTLQEEAQAPETIIRAMGHESFATTTESYIRPESLWAGQQRRFEEVIGPALNRALGRSGVAAALEPKAENLGSSGLQHEKREPKNAENPTISVELNGIEPSAS